MFQQTAVPFKGFFDGFLWFPSKYLEIEITYFGLGKRGRSKSSATVRRNVQFETVHFPQTHFWPSLIGPSVRSIKKRSLLEPIGAAPSTMTFKSRPSNLLSTVYRASSKKASGAPSDPR